MTTNNKKSKNNRCKCGHKETDHAKQVGPCLDAYRDKTGTTHVCWCNGFEQWVPMRGRKSLSTAKRADPQYFGKSKGW